MKRGDLLLARQLAKSIVGKPRKKTPGELFFDQFTDDEIEEVEPILIKALEGRSLTESEHSFMADVVERYGPI